jgi:hypothetical protein
MPLVYCSIADNHTGKWIGGAHMLDVDVASASAAAARLLPGRCVEVAAVELPRHIAERIPRELWGKLLDRAQMAELSGKTSGDVSLVHMVSDGDTLRPAKPEDGPGV